MTADPPGDLDPDADPDAGGPPRALIFAAVALAVATIGTILVLAATHQAPQQPVAVAAVAGPAGRQPRLPGIGAGAAAAARGLSTRGAGATGARRRDRLAGRPGQRAGGVALWPRPPGRLRGGIPDPDRRPGAVVRGERSSAIRRRGQIHLVRRGPTRIRGADAAGRIGADSHPGALRGDRPHHRCGAHQSGARALAEVPTSADPHRGPAPSRPWSPTASGSRRRWPPTSADTSRSW